MALRVSYKNRIGYYTKTEKWKDEPERKFKNWMCHANDYLIELDNFTEKKAQEYISNLI